jgi:hypothetical protein
VRGASWFALFFVLFSMMPGRLCIGVLPVISTFAGIFMGICVGKIDIYSVIRTRRGCKARRADAEAAWIISSQVEIAKFRIQDLKLIVRFEIQDFGIQNLFSRTKVSSRKVCTPC